MYDERRAVAGDLVHAEFVAVNPVGNWPHKMVQAWQKRRDKVLKHSKTLKQGHKQAITHAGSSAWTAPAFLGQETTPESNIIHDDEATRLQESIRMQTIQLRRLQGNQQLNDELKSDDSDDDFEEDSAMSEDSGAIKVAPKEDKAARMLRQLLESNAAMEAKIDERIDARLTATLRTFFGQSGFSDASKSDGSNAGGHHSATSFNHE